MQERSPPKRLYMWGSYSGRGSQGLYVFEFARSTGQMAQIQTVSDREDPKFQALHPEGTYLYSVSSESFSEETSHGTIAAYRIDQQTGKLTQIDERSVKGRGPAHVSVGPQEDLPMCRITAVGV